MVSEKVQIAALGLEKLYEWVRYLMAVHILKQSEVGIMVEKIRKILLNIDGINGWKINEKTVESNDHFSLEKLMNRGKDVTHISLTLYKTLRKWENIEVQLL